MFICQSFYVFPLESSIHSLNMFVQKTGRVLVRDLNQVIRSLKSAKHLDPLHALFVLRCCGSQFVDTPKVQRQEYVESWWKTMQDMQVPLDISHYNTLMRVHMDNDKEFSPTDFLSEIASKGLEANRITYQQIIAKYCQVF